METLTRRGRKVKTIADLKKPKAYPLQNFETLKTFIGFNEILIDLDKLNLYSEDSERLEYCNSLFWYIGLLNNNWQKVPDILYIVINDIEEKNISEKYGNVFLTHFLKLIKGYELHPWERIPAPNASGFYNDCFYQFLYRFYNEILSGTKRKIYIFNTGQYALEHFFINGDHKLRSEFFIECYYYFKRRYLEKYNPVEFLGLVNEYISYAFEIGVGNPIRFLEAITKHRNDANEIEKEIECNAVLYWVLLGIKYRLGPNPFISYFSEPWQKEPIYNQSSENELDLLYRFLNGEAKILNCSPDLDPNSPQLERTPEVEFYIKNKEVETKEVDKGSDLQCSTIPNGIKASRAAHALAYYYKQVCKLVPHSEMNEDGKVAALEKLGSSHGYEPKGFVNIYYDVTKKDQRAQHNRSRSIKQAIVLLAEFPEAREKAMKELKEYEPAYEAA
ncbi:hypothetical protein I5M27_12860 [Adhaeribacter sp. BT258]|uniref:Uncharacterized protein n=1 Tax=Adhaeribacter terrigena TaxID=2793070 RepID=A0ABS1C5D4_9BACT|nr:hypothetical protein [Adhaeribacter terrigena]MBK0403878.1 hypothetical protein [Adhaeribacter terrigena]